MDYNPNIPLMAYGAQLHADRIAAAQLDSMREQAYHQYRAAFIGQGHDMMTAHDLAMDAVSGYSVQPQRSSFNIFTLIGWGVIAWIAFVVVFGLISGTMR